MNQSKIVIYQTQDGKTSIDVKLEQDTVWLTQPQMAELFQDGDQTYETTVYNLDVVISVGYRVKSQRSALMTALS